MREFSGSPCLSRNKQRATNFIQNFRANQLYFISENALYGIVSCSVASQKLLVLEQRILEPVADLLPVFFQSLIHPALVVDH